MKKGQITFPPSIWSGEEEKHCFVGLYLVILSVAYVLLYICLLQVIYIYIADAPYNVVQVAIFHMQRCDSEFFPCYTERTAQMQTYKPDAITLLSKIRKKYQLNGN